MLYLCVYVCVYRHCNERTMIVFTQSAVLFRFHSHRPMYNFQALNSARFTHLRKGHKSNITTLHSICFTVYYIGIKSNVCASFIFFYYFIFILSIYNTVLRLMMLLLHFTFSSVPNIAIVPSVCCEVDFDIVCSALSFWRLWYFGRECESQWFVLFRNVSSPYATSVF